MLKEIQWKNHKALGNLNLDFSKPDGSVYSTIILAGENGTGKTTILETLGQFLMGHSMEPFEYIDYDVNSKSFHIEPLTEQASFGFHARKEATKDQVTDIWTNHNNSPDKMHNDPNDIRAYGCIYSSAKSKFDTKDIQNVTSQQIDTTQYSFDDNNDFTTIKQLLIDIATQDSVAFTNEAKNNNQIHWTDFEPKSKMYRFQSAFNDFFEHIKYDSIDGTTGQQRVIFKKHNHKIYIDDLSTGEKQIVFRGAYLLRNIGKMDGGIILIDEPELSMHPKWQEKILSFYKKLFARNNEQKGQLLIATHSEYVIRKALEDKKDTLVIILKDENGVVKPTKAEAPYLLSHLTSAEVNFSAFGIYSIDYHIELYGRLQEKTGNNNILAMDSYIRNNIIYNTVNDKMAIKNGTTITETLPTYIRNAIDHPDNPSRCYTDDELKKSTDILIKLIQAIP